MYNATLVTRKAGSEIIPTPDCANCENHCRITSSLTKRLLFTVNHIFVCISCMVCEGYGWFTVRGEDWNVWVGQLFFIQTLDLNPYDSGYGISRLWGSMQCLLMPRFIKSPGHQQSWYSLCRTYSKYCCSRVHLIKPTTWYASKFEYIFYIYIIFKTMQHVKNLHEW